MAKHLLTGLVALLALSAGARGQTKTPSPIRRTAAEQPDPARPAPPAEPGRVLHVPDDIPSEFTGPEPAAPCDWGTCFWARADYLAWWVRGSKVPALVTTSRPGTPQSRAGVLGLPPTRLLFGERRVDDDDRHGARITLGLWVDPEHHFSIEGNLFALGQVENGFFARSLGRPILARPFFNVGSPQRDAQRQDAQLVAFPGVVEGAVSVNSSSQLGGGEIYLREYLCGDGGYRIDWFGGYRYLRLNERLLIREAVTSVDPAGPVPAGTRIFRHDRFDAENYFHAVEVGTAAALRQGSMTFEVVGKVAFGGTHTDLDIVGATRRRLPGSTSEGFRGGLLALGTNIGHREGARFSVVPEVALNVGYQLTEQLRLHGGYTFLYWTNVARPGDQIDLSVNPSQIPPGTLTPNTPRRPTFDGFNDANVWVQGINLGLEYRY